MPPNWWNGARKLPQSDSIGVNIGVKASKEKPSGTPGSSLSAVWSGRRGSNSRPFAWEANGPPLCHFVVTSEPDTPDSYVGTRLAHLSRSEGFLVILDISIRFSAPNILAAEWLFDPPQDPQGNQCPFLPWLEFLQAEFFVPELLLYLVFKLYDLVVTNFCNCSISSHVILRSNLTT